MDKPDLKGISHEMPAWFEPSFVKADHLDPLAPTHIEFDWEILRRLLGEAKDEMTVTDYELLASVMGELLTWIVRGDDLKIIGRRAVALAWTVNPDIFKGVAVTKLSTRFGLRRQALSDETGDARRKFGISNRASKHAWNFKANPGAQ